MLQSIFVAEPEGPGEALLGAPGVAKQMQPKFAKLETYYRSAASGGWLGAQGAADRRAISRQIPENYSPTSFLINTLLPPNSTNRTMDYVATIVIE